VTSDAYKRALRAKGGNPTAWNWQMHERSEGFIPGNEEEEEKDLKK
jgi:hypothetical protein